jgi:hypothetical protein
MVISRPCIQCTLLLLVRGAQLKLLANLLPVRLTTGIGVSMGIFLTGLVFLVVVIVVLIKLVTLKRNNGEYCTVYMAFA